MAKVSGETVVSYVHNSVADGMGKIGVLVGLSGNNEAFGKQVAMHIAAANPTALNEASLDPVEVEKEKQVQMDIARESGKPEAVIEKMIALALLDHILDVFLLFHLFLLPQTCFCLSVVERIQELIRPMLSLQLAYLRL